MCSRPPIFVEVLEGEVNNGGFDQFFYNNAATIQWRPYKLSKQLQRPRWLTSESERLLCFPAAHRQTTGLPDRKSC